MSHFNLLKWFDRQGIRYSRRHQGIYDISDLQFIKCQVIITEGIDKYAEKEVDKKIKEERTIIAQIVSALAADKDNDTIVKELNCTLDQIAPIRAAMGK